MNIILVHLVVYKIELVHVVVGTNGFQVGLLGWRPEGSYGRFVLRLGVYPDTLFLQLAFLHLLKPRYW